jgi:hypothetical protein
MTIVEMILAYLLSWKFIAPALITFLTTAIYGFSGMWVEKRSADAHYREMLQDAREKLRRETALLQAMSSGSGSERS